MDLRKIKTIYLKEMLDTLRDRRTLISMILIPIILFPVLIIGMSAVMVMIVKKTEAEVTKIVITGKEFAPALVSLIHDGKTFEIVEEEDFKSALKEKKISAALEFTDDFEKKIREEDSTEAIIYYDATELKSEITSVKLKDILKDYQDSVVAARLSERQIDKSLLYPIKVSEENLAPKEKMGGFMLAMFLPYVIVILAMSGAMYPAIDLTAGEKERGTLETILVTPVSRLDIAAGKFLTVLTASMITILLATISMSLSASFGFAKMGQFASGQPIQFSIRPLSILMLLVLMFPIACLFSSALLSVALFAKSYKEAQSYVTPLMFVVILPAMVSFLPGFELDWRLALIPVVNISMATKEVLLGTYKWSFILLIFISTFIYAGFSIFVTKRLFEKEEVLFRT
jgi:sodium transport system permease protein